MNLKQVKNRVGKLIAEKAGFRVEFWRKDKDGAKVKLVHAIGPPADRAAHIVQFEEQDFGL